MRFGVLGPVELSADGQPAALGGPKQRALLAFLLLHPNEAVSRDRLIDALWGESPPPSASAALDTYIYRLRKITGHDRLARRGYGYMLVVGPGELDADRFNLLVADAAVAAGAGDSRGAARMLADALRLWRGPALADVLYQPFAGASAQRLEERRLDALESRIEAELDCGAGAALVPELEQLVASHPIRERPVAALMRALYRAGRQVDALAACQALRGRLLDELGLEPGPEVRELERRILQQDPALAAPPPAPLPADAAPAPAHRTIRGRRGRTWAAVTGVAVAGLAVAIAVATGFLSSPALSRAAPSLPQGADGVVALSTVSEELVTATRLTGAPEGVSGGNGSVWAAEPDSGAVSRIQPGSGATVDQVPVGGEPGSVVSGGGAVWAASAVGATVTRIDPATGGVTQVINLPGSRLVAMAFGAGRLWVADSATRELFAIDPADGSLTRSSPLDLEPGALAVADGAVWVAGFGNATVEKIDPGSRRVTGRVRVGNGPAALASGAGALWVANSLDATVSRVDPDTLTAGPPIPVGSGPVALAFGAGALWVANQDSGTISRVDPRRDQVVSSVRTGGAPTSLALDGGRLWAGVAADGGSHRGGTLVIVAATTFGVSRPVDGAAVDPAFYNQAETPQFIGLAYDTLVTFQKSPGAGGARLVPDLALGLPVPSDSGRAYAFRLRPGIRYSTGQPLRASDVRRGIERLFRLHSPASSYYSGLTGAAACARRPAHCDLSRGIVTDDTTGAIVFHFTAPDPEFLFDLAISAYSAPVPHGTPDHETGQRTVPGTGPYRIATVSSTQIRFTRNPNFREWSRAAQPDGNPDAIVWQSEPSSQAAITAVEHGRGDWIAGRIPPAQYRQLSLRSPAQLHSSPEFTIDYAAFNTHLAPFNDLRVRQALNYAINRRTIVGLYGGPSFAVPTCQLITPSLPGYRRYCPYTRHPRPDGAWGAPNLARARRLVRASRTRGERIDVWGPADNAYLPTTVPAYLTQVLRTLGYRARLHLAPMATMTLTMHRHFPLAADGEWLADYPDPASYLPLFTSCNGGNSNGYYCSPKLDREMSQASRLELSDPARASALWATVDHQLTDNAVWVPTVNEREVEFVSRRLRNYEYNPVWGFLADQAWLSHR